jgi:hypothetical protein
LAGAVSLRSWAEYFRQSGPEGSQRLRRCAQSNACIAIGRIERSLSAEESAASNFSWTRILIWIWIPPYRVH